MGKTYGGISGGQNQSIGTKEVHWDKTSQLVRARAVQASDNSNTEPGRFSPNKSHTISKPCTQ